MNAKHTIHAQLNVVLRLNVSEAYALQPITVKLNPLRIRATQHQPINRNKILSNNTNRRYHDTVVVVDGRCLN